MRSVAFRLYDLYSNFIMHLLLSVSDDYALCVPLLLLLFLPVICTFFNRFFYYYHFYYVTLFRGSCDILKSIYLYELHFHILLYDSSSSHSTTDVR